MFPIRPEIIRVKSTLRPKNLRQIKISRNYVRPGVKFFRNILQKENEREVLFRADFGPYVVPWGRKSKSARNSIFPFDFSKLFFCNRLLNSIFLYDPVLLFCSDILNAGFQAIMTVSNGGNPNGSSMSLDRRQKLIEIADIYDLLIIEDDPHYLLQFEEPVESIFSLDWNSSSPSRRTIRSDSLSKVVSAGIRVGWITGPSEVISKVELHTQVSSHWLIYGPIR